MTKSYLLSFTLFGLFSFTVHIAVISYFFEQKTTDLEGGDFEITAAIGNSFADFVQGTTFTPVEPQRNINETSRFDKVLEPDLKTSSNLGNNDKVSPSNPSTFESKVISGISVTDVTNLDIKKSISNFMDLPSKKVDKLSSVLVNKFDMPSQDAVTYNSQFQDNTLQSQNQKNPIKSVKQTLEVKKTTVFTSHTSEKQVAIESIADAKVNKNIEALDKSGPLASAEQLKPKKPTILSSEKPDLKATVGNALETTIKGSSKGEEQASAVVPKDLAVNKKVRSGNDSKSNYAGIVLEILKKQRKFKSQSSGSVRVKLSIDGKGNLSEVKVLKSSGFPRDDKNARRFIKKAAPFPKPPNSNRITFEVELKLK